MDFVTLIINLLVIAVIFTLVLFLVKKAPVEEPIKGVIVWIVYVVFVLWLIAYLLGAAPPLIHTNSWRLR